MAKAKDDLGVRVNRLLRTQEAGKRAYKKADALMDALELELEPGQIVTFPNGKKFRFVDKFANKNRINVGLNARRYEFEEVIL